MVALVHVQQVGLLRVGACCEGWEADCPGKCGGGEVDVDVSGEVIGLLTVLLRLLLLLTRRGVEQLMQRRRAERRLLAVVCLLWLLLHHVRVSWLSVAAVAAIDQWQVGRLEGRRIEAAVRRIGLMVSGWWRRVRVSRTGRLLRRLPALLLLLLLVLLLLGVVVRHAWRVVLGGRRGGRG